MEPVAPEIASPRHDGCASSSSRRGGSTESVMTDAKSLIDGLIEWFETNDVAEKRRLLLDAGARTDALVPVLLRGEGLEWETTSFDITPISFCRAGLMRQAHRDEGTIELFMIPVFTRGGRASG